MRRAPATACREGRGDTTRGFGSNLGALASDDARRRGCGGGCVHETWAARAGLALTRAALRYCGLGLAR